jgi:bud site selection protein 31
MPPVRAHRNKKRPPPAGYSDIEDTLLQYDNQMRDALSLPTDGKKKHESQWPIFELTHRKSRYIYSLYYEREAISKELYDWLLKNGQADASLIAKWKKQGYEKLCCLRCIQTKETNFGGACICRVPKASLRRSDADGEGGEKDVGGGGVQCVNCGCRGCASSD